MFGRSRVMVVLGLSLLATACAGDSPQPTPAVTTAAAPATTNGVASTMPAAVTAPDAAPQPPAGAPGPTLPAPTTTTVVQPVAVQLAFDYESAAAHAATSSTEMGTIEWYRTSVVPSDWLYSGFPTPTFVADPFAYDRTWARVQEAAACCQTITRTDDGWLGIGPSADGARCTLSVWESPNGVDWFESYAVPFGADGPCSAGKLVEHGRSAAFFGGGPTGSAVWVSHGLETWSMVDVDFTEEGTDTFITSAVAGPSGFGIFGVRVSHEPTARSESGIRLGPYPFEWVAWLSADGADWRPVNMAEMFGQPWCQPNRPEPCGHIDAMMTDDGIVAYLHQASDSTVPDMRDGWALWVGLVE